MEKNGAIMLTAEDGSEEAFFVVEKAEIAGREYLLVTNEPMDAEETEDEEAEALILRVNKDQEEDETLVYDVVEDEEELVILSKYFEELLEDEVSIEE
nr:DUF1292 domain-containing protein [Eubacterium sp.]